MTRHDYDPTARYHAGMCPVPDCDGPGGLAGTCDLHFHKGGCASEWRGDDGCSCGLTAGSAPLPERHNVLASDCAVALNDPTITVTTASEHCDACAGDRP